VSILNRNHDINDFGYEYISYVDVAPVRMRSFDPTIPNSYIC